jgi:hypothetical protein
MRPRDEAVAFIEEQLAKDGKHDWPVRDNDYTHGGQVPQWHYGKIELRRLMDFIYGQEPQSDSERIA